MSVVRCCCRALAATRQRTLCERSVKVLTSASVGLDERLAKLVHPWELLQLSGCADTQAEQTLRKFRQKYKQTHAMATVGDQSWAQTHVLELVDLAHKLSARSKWE